MNGRNNSGINPQSTDVLKDIKLTYDGRTGSPSKSWRVRYSYVLSTPESPPIRFHVSIGMLTAASGKLEGFRGINGTHAELKKVTGIKNLSHFIRSFEDGKKPKALADSVATTIATLARVHYLEELSQQ